MDTMLQFLAIVGTIDAAALVLIAGYALYLWISGISPVLWRLGNGLARRRLAVFAKGDNLTGLKSLLLDSKLFRPKNISDITRPEDIEGAKGASVYLVYWPDWAAHIDSILESKTPSCAVVVYQPYDQGRIPDEQMKRLDGKRHTAVTNFRGRLLNDIVTSMITTSYEKE